ncbi:helix-turn-helix transcriptional regulator [Novosphingobium terrae]|uniref:helix-turn-helix transcriptional regulator n=1 Tax=Novosphingobium terrae TaxID=2726189 RepID=UPI00197F2D60|nr:AlpA family phage regulatory protein [Novosphingobium terrae]
MSSPVQPDRYLRLGAVLDRTGLGRSTIYRKIKEGTFPSQVRISTRCAGWLESAINDWLKNPARWTTENGSS